MTWAMSCSEWMRVSRTLRRTAMPMPMANPTRAPSIRLSGTFGLEAAAGTVAGWIVSIFTRLRASPSGFSRLFTTTSAKFVPTAFAIAAACSGSLSATAMWIRTVLRGELASICAASCALVWSSSSCCDHPVEDDRAVHDIDVARHRLAGEVRALHEVAARRAVAGSHRDVEFCGGLVLRRDDDGIEGGDADSEEHGGDDQYPALVQDTYIIAQFHW